MGFSLTHTPSIRFIITALCSRLGARWSLSFVDQLGELGRHLSFRRLVRSFDPRLCLTLTLGCSLCLSLGALKHLRPSRLLCQPVPFWSQELSFDSLCHVP